MLLEIHATIQWKLFRLDSDPQSEISREWTPRKIFNHLSLDMLETGNREPTKTEAETKFFLSPSYFSSGRTRFKPFSSVLASKAHPILPFLA